jgi:hypothetical protein
MAQKIISRSILQTSKVAQAPLMQSIPAIVQTPQIQAMYTMQAPPLMQIMPATMAYSPAISAYQAPVYYQQQVPSYQYAIGDSGLPNSLFTEAPREMCGMMSGDTEMQKINTKSKK